MIDAVCLTLDVDWVPDAVLAEIVEMIEDAGVAATFFATHLSPLLVDLDPARFEVGLHPDFRDADLDMPLAELRRAYPHAIGARSHGLNASSRVLERYAAHGLRYETNVYLPLHQGLHPVDRRPDLVSIPFCWSDDAPGGPSGLEALLAGHGLRVLNFHPIHVFMNTRDDAHYQEFRRFTRDTAELERRRSLDGPGVRRLFELALEHLGRSGSQLLRDVHDDHVSARASG